MQLAQLAFSTKRFVEERGDDGEGKVIEICGRIEAILYVSICEGTRFYWQLRIAIGA